MASLTRWTWVWVNSRSWWWTGRPGVLRFMGSQRVRHDWATELKAKFIFKWEILPLFTQPLRACTKSRIWLFVTPGTVACCGSFVCGILQARILEWVTISFFRKSFQPRVRTMSLAFPALIGRFFTTGATQIAPQTVHIQEKKFKKKFK